MGAAIGGGGYHRMKSSKICFPGEYIPNNSLIESEKLVKIFLNFLKFNFDGLIIGGFEIAHSVYFSSNYQHFYHVKLKY